MNRLLTHEISPVWKDNAFLFKQALIPLLENAALSSVLIQFPESFHYTPENRVYLANLLGQLDPLPCVVEFRHREWIRASVFDGLEKRGTGIVFCDMPQLKNLPDGKTVNTPFIGPNAYIRLHGRNNNAWYVQSDNGDTPRYDYDYSPDELRSFIPIIQKAQNEGKIVQLFFNNHPKGTGFKNAQQLQEMLGINADHSLNPSLF